MKLFEAFRQKWIDQQERDVPQTKKITGDMTLGETAPEFHDDVKSRQLALLTPREHELLILLLEGYTLKESAERLSVKYSTVNTHMTAIYKKLKVNSRAELIIHYRDNCIKTD